MHRANEKPGEGLYLCTNCGQHVYLDHESELPLCPQCANTIYNEHDQINFEPVVEKMTNRYIY